MAICLVFYNISCLVQAKKAGGPEYSSMVQLTKPETKYTPVPGTLTFAVCAHEPHYCLMALQLKTFANPQRRQVSKTNIYRLRSEDFPDSSVPRYGIAGHTLILPPSKTPDVCLELSLSLLGFSAASASIPIRLFLTCRIAQRGGKIMLNILFMEEKIAAENCHIVWSIFNFIWEPCK